MDLEVTIIVAFRIFTLGADGAYKLTFICIPFFYPAGSEYSAGEQI